MKIAGSTIFFIIICIFLSRCSPENKANNTNKYQMVELGVIKLPLDSFYGNSSVKSKAIIDGNGIEWLYANYPNSSGIPVYNLSTGELSRIIPLQTEGADGIGNLLYSQVLDIDSILLTPTDKIRFYLLNGKGEKFDAYNLIYEDKGNKRWLQTIMQHPYLYEGKIYFSFLPNFDALKRKYDLDAPLFAKTITRDSVVIIPELKYPGFLTQTSKNEVIMPEQIIPSYLIKNNVLVYTIPASDSIYTFNLDARESMNYAARSNFHKEDFQYLKREGALKQLYQTFLYFNLIYDKYHNIYYRINLLPIESPKRIPEDGTLLLGKPVSIQIFDSLFNCIGETLLPKGKVKIFDYFIGSKGLYISNNHPDNPDFKEDSLNYTIYVPKIIK